MTLQPGSRLGVVNLEDIRDALEYSRDVGLTSHLHVFLTINGNKGGQHAILYGPAIISSLPSSNLS